MENYKKRAIRFLVNLSLREKKDPRVIKYMPSKTEISKKEEKFFPRATSKRSEKYAPCLSDMLEELECEERANVHSLMVYKDGEIVLEVSKRGYDTNIFHLAHSMSKTVTAIAVGFLYDERKINLESSALDYFPEITARDERVKKISVKDLLTMRSGVGFAEIGAVSEAEWTKAFFSSETEFRSGERFKYNSMNSYILARIVTRITGKPLSKYLKEKLFEPLAINNYLWEIGPEGSEKGGFGLYLSCESFLKIGIMLASGGSFGKRRILSEEYLALMLTAYSTPSETDSEYAYGFQIWLGADGDEILLNGMLGQNVWISRKSGFIVSMNSGNNEIFSESPSLKIIKKHLLLTSGKRKAERHKLKRLKEISDNFSLSKQNVFPIMQKRGFAYTLGIKNRVPFDTRWDLVLGEYATRDNNTSILPLFVRTMQNNFTGGIERISFERVKDTLVLTSYEGSIPYELTVGLYDYTENVLNFNGEKYIIRALGECALDEDRRYVYKIQLIFPELPNTRLLKITKTDSGILINMSENPNEKVGEAFFESFLRDARGSFTVGLIEKKLGEDFFKKRLHSAFNPSLDAIDTKNFSWESIIASDNLKLAEEREKNSKFITALISKFLNEREAKENSAGGFLRDVFAKILSLLFEKLKPEEDASETIELSDDIITFLEENE